MSRTITSRELRNDNARIMAEVSAGESFVVTRNGEPVAELRPVARARPTFISREDVVASGGACVRIDHRLFRADLDGVAQQQL